MFFERASSLERVNGVALRARCSVCCGRFRYVEAAFLRLFLGEFRVIVLRLGGNEGEGTTSFGGEDIIGFVASRVVFAAYRAQGRARVCLGSNEVGSDVFFAGGFNRFFLRLGVRIRYAIRGAQSNTAYAVFTNDFGDDFGCFQVVDRTWM